MTAERLQICTRNLECTELTCRWRTAQHKPTHPAAEWFRRYCRATMYTRLGIMPRDRAFGEIYLSMPSGPKCTDEPCVCVLSPWAKQGGLSRPPPPAQPTNPPAPHPRLCVLLEWGHFLSTLRSCPPASVHRSLGACAIAAAIFKRHTLLR